MDAEVYPRNPCMDPSGVLKSQLWPDGTQAMIVVWKLATGHTLLGNTVIHVIKKKKKKKKIPKIF